MKKIFIALALLASVYIAGAQTQTKSPADAKKALESATEAAANPKKAAKAATWMKLGEAYVSAYEAPAGSIWGGATKQELALVMGNEKPSSTETVEVGGQQLTKETYADKNLYFQADGKLAAVEVTKPVYPDALSKAVEAYSKAYTLDSKKKGDVDKALQSISEKYVQDAYNKYTLGDYKGASEEFEKAADALGTAPLSKIDTNSIYNAGFTAWMVKDNDRAKTFFEKCYKLGYYSENGELYAKLADVDTLNAKTYLEEGFSKYPQSQSILIGLINYYLKSGESTDTLFTLLDKAKENEPDNASLYYVEGNIRAQLGQTDKAVEAYEKCSQINPQYEFGYIGEGIMYYNKALEVQNKAQNEFDDNKYMALVKDFEQDLKNCIAPFEKAYEISKDDSIKVSIAEYLKNAYYRFREEKPEYQAAYDKYSAILSNGTAAQK